MTDSNIPMEFPGAAGRPLRNPDASIVSAISFAAGQSTTYANDSIATSQPPRHNDAATRFNTENQSADVLMDNENDNDNDEYDEDEDEDGWPESQSLFTVHNHTSHPLNTLSDINPRQSRGSVGSIGSMIPYDSAFGSHETDVITDNPGMINGHPASPRSIRRLRNRMAAARMRTRQKQHLEDLEQRKEKLEQQAANLESELRAVQRKNNPLNSSIDKLSEMIDDLTKVESTMLSGIDECKSLLKNLERLYWERNP
ncbi:hypothetical protein BX661DRAFT_181213 [Kickxella alabastrina]|uniref:uncharacterized protein n=1 Tax=Kickxella alabastrina TaxID=61397 RepID=UPI00221FB021|nr:uncharacterized protein BX661DRAFT_181213 [Kickxella alabastrina]KAI7830159.1 hypothetical protein BX661DRAFT_181213 [Kickxella alabastrina]